MTIVFQAQLIQFKLQYIFLFVNLKIRFSSKPLCEIPLFQSAHIEEGSWKMKKKSVVQKVALRKIR